MTEEPPLHVTRYHQGGFLVRSEADPETHYLVTLDDPDYPAGACQCMDYDCRKGPAVRRNLPTDHTCKHVRKARAELDHAAVLCAAAGYPEQLAARLIPTLEEWTE